jgi:nucleotide-binding universal stress UspA family protein
MLLPLSKILTPVDFSERCVGAMSYADALGAHFHCEVILLHVLEPLRYDQATTELGAPVIERLARKRHEEASKELETCQKREFKAARIRRVLLEGDPAKSIVEFADRERVDLITLPTHGFGPFRRFILGSVAAKVLHDADCPVWTGVHIEEARAVEPISFRRVLCAVDLGPESRKAICWAAKFAREFEARLTVLHALPAIEVGVGEYFDTNLGREVEEAARSELGKHVADLKAEAEIVVAHGDAPKAVSRAAAEGGADVLVIGRGSAAGAFGRLRTNAYAIIRESPCPVVSV